MLPALALALAQSTPESGAPRAAPGWDGFPVFVWRERHRGKPLPEALAAPFGGVILMREEPSDWARERGLAYLVWNVAGRDALHLDADEAWRARVERWIETRDEALLVRTPCLNDPETLRALDETLERTLALHGAHPGLGFVLGDEVSLTPNGDPFDLCRCGHCEAEWRAYAQSNGLPERAPLTDEVRLALLEDDVTSLGAWLARRRFDRERMTAVLARLAGKARTAPRHVPLGLLGISDPVAFGSLALERVLPCFELVECYPAGNMRELLFALRPEQAPWQWSLATLFLQDESPAGASWLVWEHWLRGGEGLVLWSDEALESRPAQRERLAETVQRIRDLEPGFSGPHPHFRQGFALIHDADSIALSWLRDALLDGPTWPHRRAGFQQENGTRERKVRSWLRLLEDCGHLPGAIPLRDSPGDSLEFRVWILAETLVLDPEDVRRLEEHLQTGGALIVDGRLGWVDRVGRPLDQDVLGRLRAQAPERVLAAPPGLESYLSTRLDRESNAALRSFVDEAASAAGVPKPLQAPSEDVPWLIAARARWKAGTLCGNAPPEAWLVAMLPNLATREERGSALRELPLDVRAPEGYDLEWIHPADGKLLPAGDAALYRLTRRDVAPR